MIVLSRMDPVAIAGHSLAVYTHGSTGPDIPVIVALHGFTGSAEDFIPLIEADCQGDFRWIIPDLPGHGASESPENVDPYLLGNVLQLIDRCRQLAGSQSVHLLGYSMGGRLALQYLRWAVPMKTCLIGASPGLKDPVERTNRRNTDREWMGILDQSVDEFCRKWESQPLIEPQTRIDEPHRTQLAERRRNNRPHGLQNTLLTLGSGRLPSLWSSLAGLPPTHCLFGEEDAKFAAIAGDMSAANPGFKPISIPSAGHAAHLENPAAVMALLQKIWVK